MDQSLNHNCGAIAEAYYTASSQKDLVNLAMYVHPEIRFKAPFSKGEGKEVFLESVKRFLQAFKELRIRSVVGAKDQAVAIYDVEMTNSLVLSTASFMKFDQGLISEIEIIFDARPLDPRFAEGKKEEVAQR